MDEMRNITLHHLEKYDDTAAYAEVAYGICKNLKKSNYCICIEADKIPRYPLRCMMEQFRLTFVKGGTPTETEINGTPRMFAELETRDDSIDAFSKMVNFATAVGNTVVNFRLSGYDMLGVELATTNCVINGQQVNVPFIGCREDHTWGDLNFCIRTPEPGLRTAFQGGSVFDLPQLNEKCKIRAVVTRRYFAFLIYMEKQVNKALVFNKSKMLLWQSEGDRLEEELMEGEIYRIQ